MALALTQVITEDRASGGQVIDGSLKFDATESQYLTRTPSSSGNLRKWTWSSWTKRDDSGNSAYDMLLQAGTYNGPAGNIGFKRDANDCIQVYQYDSGYDYNKQTNDLFRDFSGWYHIVVVVDIENATAGDRVQLYVNNRRVTSFSTSVDPGNTQDTVINSTVLHYIGGADRSGGNDDFGGRMSQVYFIDGQALSPTDFGFTDPLTNTWRPKKYTGTFTGTNTFYLPFDGNSPIGEDKSGNGNNWTPVNFGGSNSIEKATGALPILNTTNGGRVATVGQRSDSDSSSLVLALPLVGNSNDVHHLIKGSGSAKAITDNGNVAATNTQSNFYGGSFTFDGTGDYLTTPANTDFDFGTGAYTIEMWLRTTQDSGWLFYNASNNTGMRLCIGINGTNSSNQGKLEFNEQVSNGDDYNRGTSRVDDGKWHHVAVCRGSSGDTTKLYVDGNLEATGNANRNFDNDNLVYIGARESLTGNEFNGQLQDLRVYKGVAKYTSNFIPASTDPDILPDTPSGVAGGSALTLTPNSATEGAVTLDGIDDYLRIDRGSNTDFEFGTGDFTIEFWAYIAGSDDDVGLSTVDDGSYSTGGWVFESNQQFRISNSSGTYETWGTFTYPLKKWIHVAVSRSGSTGYGFIDGIQQFSFSTSIDNGFGGTNDLSIGSRTTTTNLRTQVISNLRIIKGTGLYTSNFTPSTTPLTNVTNTKLLCCQSSTSATAAAVTPSAIEANGGASATTFSPFLKENINTVRGQESGYATYLPFGNDQTYHNGNLQLKTVSPGYGRITLANTAIPDGEKFFIEYTVTDTGASNDVALGVDNGNSWSIYNYASNASSNSLDGDYRAYRAGGGTFVGSTYTSGTPGETFVDGDVIGTAIDRVNDEISYYRNGVKVYTHSIASSPSTGNYYPSVGTFTGTADVTINAGQKPFKYAPPEGFKALCLANLPRPTEAAVRPDKYFKTILYTGNSVNNRTITGVGFQPDFVWVKNKSDTDGWSHILTDSVRGGGPSLQSANTQAEYATNPSGYVSAFASDGFVVTEGDTRFSNTNGNGASYVAWCWKAGGPAVSNTDGSITSSVSANQDSGFSIVSYTGNGSSSATVGHGLGVVPSMIIAKSRNTSEAWMVKHKDLASNNVLELANTNATADATGFSNGSLGNLTSDTTFGFVSGSIGVDSVNKNNDPVIAYCFAEVPGFSKFGIYTGNGNADGPFIHLGFKPAWLLLKRIDSTSSWFMLDTARDTYNVSENYLIADGNNEERTYTSVDFLSNGFKARNSSSSFNTSGATHMYAAFAEAPTNNLFGGQANAR